MRGCEQLVPASIQKAAVQVHSLRSLDVVCFLVSSLVLFCDLFLIAIGLDF